ncbi:hypothetical protein PMI14_04963 [Acidovorax sp. CF316]|uniref:SHOCT domain-containing protein n=1 Tax=Acidovorax sp. CF316 TaxID=1144317 RepID=UPI00026BEC3B|nr:SHOCT domain-containing protein [Acidovorax sp. CF316]EJE50401.1 hypothetical protein PMI14_04963 [Acidovorax sp. CF316]
MSAVYCFEGAGSVLEVFEDKVKIMPKGFLDKLLHGGERNIPYTSIQSIQFREAGGLLAGRIQFIVPGANGSEDMANAVYFSSAGNFAAREIYEFIEQAVAKPRNPEVAGGPASMSDELIKLAELRDRGILTEEEFLMAKKKILS